MRQACRQLSGPLLNGDRLRGTRPFRSVFQARRPFGTAGSGRMGILGGVSVSCTEDPESWIEAYLHIRPEVRRQPFASRPDGSPRGFPRPGPSSSEALRQLRLVAPRWKSRHFDRSLRRGGSPSDLRDDGIRARMGFHEGSPVFHLSHETNYFELEEAPSSRAPEGTPR